MKNYKMKTTRWKKSKQMETDMSMCWMIQHSKDVRFVLNSYNAILIKIPEVSFCS
jgi:hypothetical protein